MNLKGKTICFIGDSITEGVGASDVSKCYVSLIKQRNQDANVLNFGISGTRLADQVPDVPCNQNPDFDKYPFYSRVDELPSEVDVICIFGGTNDYGHGTAGMGKPSDQTPTTFYGGLNYLITKIINKYPFAKIVYLTPLHRETEDEVMVKADGKYALSDYVTAIKATCEYYAIPVLDLYSISQLQPRVKIIKETFMPDGLHPNDNGYVVLADIIESYLKNM